ncbi:uncharacterized protein LOC117900172 [Drosophila subobscura]|uniref:uncharacterized protein LOC117900172 n=1 Tax=Drosophila subobscura TaxID=7241 RepID=UPI00155AFB31|nr:uncharacterized protein LOC117900172 [Drosophila subobscura]
MHLISTSKSTVLSDFADLETKSIYVHANGEATDFQFNAQRRVFVEVDKMAGLAVMRIREKEEKAPEIQRVRKLTIDNAFCVCCAKQTSEEIALGQSSGCVKLYNYRTAQLIHRFPADQQRSTVVYVDYNCTDEYIAAVKEGGSINIFGTKTKQKVNTFIIDEQSTLARFHPSKRFQLSIASYKGAVTVYDFQSKRKIFHVSDAHDAPCRDVSMCTGQPSLLVSVGYDCKINIFDIRRNRAQPASSRLTYSHPLSTVALSECGTYFCAGNLKGELIAYDIRNTKSPLAVRSVHDGAVIRVAFVPTPTEEQQSSSFSSMGNVTAEATNVERVASDELRKSIAANLLNTQQQLNSMASLGYGTGGGGSARPQRDSFCDFLDAQGPRTVERMSTRLTMHRDSFDWETLGRKPTDNTQRLSICPAGGSGLSSVDNSCNSSNAESLQQTLSGPLKDRSNISGDAKLMKIAETDEHSERDVPSANCSSSTAGSDKENPQGVADAELKRRLRMLSASRNSTPHHVNITPQSSSTLLKPQQLLAKSSSGLSAQGDADVRREMGELRESMEQRIEQLEKELKYAGEKNKWQIIGQISSYWNLQLENTQEIRDGLALLLQGDRFMYEFSRLQHENQMLKAQVQHLLREREDNAGSAGE